MIAAAFDTLAARYDADFTSHRLGRWLRAEARRHVEGLFLAGDHVLDLGCGTGEDALWLAERGVRVTAIDASSAMVERVRLKIRHAGAADRVEVHHRDLSALPSLAERRGRAQIFDGALSNFGVLNCVADPRPVAAALAPLVRLGGHVAVVVMGPWCPWEVIGFLAKGRCRSAFRRFRQGRDASLGRGSVVRVWYPSPSRLRRDFAPWFRAVACAGIGVFLPPTDFRGVVDRWPRLFALAAAADQRVATVFPATWLNDHYLVVFERC